MEVGLTIAGVTPPSVGAVTVTDGRTPWPQHRLRPVSSPSSSRPPRQAAIGLGTSEFREAHHQVFPPRFNHSAVLSLIGKGSFEAEVVMATPGQRSAIEDFRPLSRCIDPSRRHNSAAIHDRLSLRIKTPAHAAQISIGTRTTTVNRRRSASGQSSCRPTRTRIATTIEMLMATHPSGPPNSLTTVGGS
jgi:hypothetical protein